MRSVGAFVIYTKSHNLFMYIHSYDLEMGKTCYCLIIKIDERKVTTKKTQCYSLDCAPHPVVVLCFGHPFPAPRLVVLAFGKSLRSESQRKTKRIEFVQH